MPVGGAALDLVGVPLPEDTISAAKDSDAVLLGAIGGYVFLYSPTNVGSTLFFFCLCLDWKIQCWWCEFRYKWDKNEKHLKPETGLLQLRAALKVFANLRPATVLPQVTLLLLLLNIRSSW